MFFELFDEFSRRSASYDRKASEKLWKSIARPDYKGPKLKRGSLERWAREDSAHDGVKQDRADESVRSGGVVCGRTVARSSSLTRGDSASDLAARGGLGAEGADLKNVVDEVLNNLETRQDVDWDQEVTKKVRNGVLDIGVRLKSQDSATFGGAGAGCTNVLGANIMLSTSDLYATVKVDDVVICERFMKLIHDKDVGASKEIDSGQTWTITRPRPTDLVFTGSGNATIYLYNFGRGNEYIDISICSNDNRRQSTRVRAKASIQEMIELYNDAMYATKKQRLRLERVVNNVFVNNGTIVINEKPRHTADFLLLPVLERARVLEGVVAVGDNDVFVLDASSNIWLKGSLNDAACVVREAASCGELKALLNEVDAAYLQSCDGPLKVLKSIMSKIKDARFERKLNNLPDHCVAFDNGMFDASSGQLRPFVKEDYVASTMGYAYMPPDGGEDVHAFYAQLFPEQDEREFFLRVVAHALFGNKRAKHFLVLCDVRDGSNGKTTVMRAVESVFGDYRALTERDFLYQCGFANPNGAAANFLSYSGKRLAFFDEPDKDSPQRPFDVRRIKDLTSGDAYIRGRWLNKNDVLEAKWEALIVIACNESNFPKIDTSDQPFVKRMKVLKMRGLFVAADVFAEHSAKDIDEQEEHVFQMRGDDLGNMMKTDAFRSVHFHVLSDACKRHLADETVVCRRERRHLSRDGYFPTQATPLTASICCCLPSTNGFIIRTGRPSDLIAFLTAVFHCTLEPPASRRPSRNSWFALFSLSVNQAHDAAISSFSVIHA